MWPFKRKNKTKQASVESSTKHRIQESDDSHFSRVPSLDFWGFSSKSINGKYTLTWSTDSLRQESSDAHPLDNITYSLAEDGEIVLKGRLNRPEYGKVADNGNFILTYSPIDGSLCAVRAFDKKGNILVEHNINAFVLENEISQNGRYAVSQCCNSDSKKDNGALIFFDLESHKINWKKRPETGWAASYSFDCENCLLFLNYPKYGQFRYTFDGEFLDREKWIEARIKYGDASEKAIAYREEGEAKEALKDFDSAISYYELALQWNPKVGVKRRLDSLKKKNGFKQA